MKVYVVLGLQWGDEGKGKIVDVLANSYPVIARFQGGPNAGHSLHFEGKKFVLHTVPSGVFRKNATNIIGNGVVIDPIIFREECEGIEATGVPVKERIMISKKAHLILPTHKILDAASEAAKGKSKIGSTLKGIGPTYMDKTGRNGLRVGDILTADFAERFKTLKDKHIATLSQFDFEYNAEEKEAEWMAAIEYLKQFNLVDGEYVANKYLNENKKILAEGAQGTMLDVDFGSYPISKKLVFGVNLCFVTVFKKVAEQGCNSSLPRAKANCRNFYIVVQFKESVFNHFSHLAMQELPKLLVQRYKQNRG